MWKNWERIKRHQFQSLARMRWGSSQVRQTFKESREYFWFYVKYLFSQGEIAGRMLWMASFFRFIIFIVHDTCSSCDFSVLLETTSTLLLLDEVDIIRSRWLTMVLWSIMPFLGFCWLDLSIDKQVWFSRSHKVLLKFLSGFTGQIMIFLVLNTYVREYFCILGGTTYLLPCMFLFILNNIPCLWVFVWIPKFFWWMSFLYFGSFCVIFSTDSAQIVLCLFFHTDNAFLLIDKFLLLIFIDIAYYW